MKMMIMRCRNLLKTFNRQFSSALYITGEKAQTNCAVLTPEIDFETQITNKNELISNVKARNLNVNVENIIKQWELFKDMKDRKIALENTRTDLAKRLAKKLITNDIEKHELHLKLVKDDLKNLKEVFYDVEESTMLNILNLPNTLHSKTPLQQEHILFEYLEKPTKFARNHIEIATEMNLCKYLDPFTCYLKSDAALCELKLLNYFREYLLGLGYVQFSNTNFCRSVVLEGCDEIQHDNKKVFALESSLNDERINKLHLCGSATLFSFMAYFTKHLVHHTLFPLKYFSIGKMYRNSGEGEASFFNLYQQSALNVFMADTENSVENVDDLVRLVRNVYDGLNVHYRIVILPANKIEKPESLRLSVQMYSNFEKTYIEVGNVSFYNSYVSKRLLFTYTFEKRWKYPSIISGSLLNFHKFLGCLFENIDKDLLKDYFAKING